MKKWATGDKWNISISLFSFHFAKNGENIRSYVLSTFKPSTGMKYKNFIYFIQIGFVYSKEEKKYLSENCYYFWYN